MVRPKRAAAELSAYGLTDADFADEDTVNVWPENWPAVEVFASMLTQWRVGVAGMVGLDYGVLPTVFRMRGIARKEWPEMFDAIRVMEDAAMKEMRSHG